jgi:hypothetical protein
MNNNLKVLSQRILSAYGEAPKQTNPFEEIANKCNESFQKGLVTESEFNSAIDYFEDLMKGMGHKYFKREGTAGNYKYYYTEAEYKKAKGGKEESKKDSLEENISTNSEGIHQFINPANGKVVSESKSGESKKDFMDRIKANTEKQESKKPEFKSSADSQKEAMKGKSESEREKALSSKLEERGLKTKKGAKPVTTKDAIVEVYSEIYSLDANKVADIINGVGVEESKKEDSDKITLDTFKNIAKESNDVDDFISKVRNIKNVPPSVANEFNEKYGKGGSLSIKQASQNFMDEFGDKKDGKTKEETSLQEKVIENQKRKSNISESEHKTNYNNFLSDLKKEKTIDGLNAKYKSISDKKEHIDMPVTMQNELADEVEKIEDKLSGGNIQKSEQPSPYDILKSDITYAFDNYENPLEITKKGSLIKSMAEAKLPLLQEDLMRTKMLCEAIKLKLQEQGVIVDEEKEFLNEVESESDMIKDDLRKYFHLKWKQKDIQSDIDTLQIVIEGIDENKSYKLTVRQIKSLK